MSKTEEKEEEKPKKIDVQQYLIATELSSTKAEQIKQEVIEDIKKKRKARL